MTVTPGGYEIAGLDTGALDASDRAEAWREEVQRNHGGLDVLPLRRSTFAGSTVVQRAHDLQLVDFTSDAVTYRRRPGEIRRDADETVRLLVPRVGLFRVEAADQRLELTPGAAAAVSMAAPFTIAHGAGACAWVFSMPTDLLPRSTDPRVPRLSDLRSGAGAVVDAMLTQLHEQRDATRSDDFLDSAEALAHLVGRRVGRATTLPPLAVVASDLVRQSSDDPSLVPATLADRLGWSLRHVQASLAKSGTTPSRLIREARLARAAARLRDPGWAERTVSDIALASGFGSLSTFHAVYREAYGAAPSAARR